MINNETETDKVKDEPIPDYTLDELIAKITPENRHAEIPTELKSVVKIIKGEKVKVAAIEEIIKMKRKSARTQDLEDIKALEKLK